MEDDKNKTNEELLAEVKELKKTVQKDSEDKKKSSLTTCLVIVGFLLIVGSVLLYLLYSCAK